LNNPKIILKMESKVAYHENIELNLKATELRLGLPGTDDSQEAALFGARNNKKRQLSDTSKECGSKATASDNAQHDADRETPPPAK
jgi:auxin-responsive protein IAA